MSTESRPQQTNKSRGRNNKDNTHVYEWIEEFQNNRNEEVQTKLVLHYESLVQSLAENFPAARIMMMTCIR